MADLKTTAEDRLRLSGAIHRMGERTGAAAERILDDIDTLLAENARLRAVAEAARDACNIALNDAGPEAFATIADLRKALAALETP